MGEIRFNNGVVEFYVNGNLVSHATISFCERRLVA